MVHRSNRLSNSVFGRDNQTLLIDEVQVVNTGPFGHRCPDATPFEIDIRRDRYPCAILPAPLVTGIAELGPDRSCCLLPRGPDLIRRCPLFLDGEQRGTAKQPPFGVGEDF